MYFRETPGGGMEPLEGEELEACQQHAWKNDPTQFAFAYFDNAFTDYPLFIEFASRLSALIWLHRSLGDAVTTKTSEHRRLLRSGSHRVPGWEYESDLMLEEEMGILVDMQLIGRGAVVAAVTAAIESLVTDILEFDDCGSKLLSNGLQTKVGALLSRWPEIPDENRDP